MPLKVKIKRDVLFPSPRPHVSAGAGRPMYTSARGGNMLMEVGQVDSCGIPHDNEGWMRWTVRRWRYLSRDGGDTWMADGPILSEGPCFSPKGDVLCPRIYWLDAATDTLWAFQGRMRDVPGAKAKHSAYFYETSRDGGATWSPARQIIHAGNGCGPLNWMPGFTCGEHYTNGDLSHIVRLDDGTIVFGMLAKDPGENIWTGYAVRFMRGKLTADGSDATWQASATTLRVPPSVSPAGVCEPDLVHLGGQRLFTTMRCQGNEATKTPSTRQCSLSEDGGRTWSDPQPLRYDDGGTVWVPASFAAFEQDPVSGRIFWFANIQPAPVYFQKPRHPLTMAELDPKRLCILRDSVTVIQALPEGAPPERTYSNFGHFRDRRTGEIVLFVPEEPKISWNDCTSDCLRFRIRLAQ